ncbi:transketolase [Singulisphaera acidiphila]|uniref:Transketolase, beta subunit n=1 Tax=Singulisphaera acidiphila (strain ATCC BAA-1392 / DSM 18658 / VKM B-2454 / MOB10) TaxID=886293 RepID=L0DE07_SINAD|nr:transketolase [Singulisphaera acidiphila]AGA27619.1 transketolase, beta subunit [Singulisphaera acidiphila DSM 18658]
MPDTLDELLTRAKEIRKDILKMTTEAGSGHPSSSMSAAEFVTALYFGGFLRYDVKNPQWPDRDRFILSKGHAAPVLYSAMAEAGYFPKEELMTLRKLGSPLEGHPNMVRLPGIEASTGSLGQGLSLGVGHALAARVDKKDYHTYVMTGDGELGEGQVWEAAASAAKYKLDNLTLIVDRNHYQQTGAAEDVLNMDPIDGKFTAFGWKTQVVNGNDMGEVLKALERARAEKGQPTCIVSLTHKGQGMLKLMAKLGDLNFHGKPMPAKYLDEALAEVSSS